MTNAPLWTAEERAVLAGVADLLIPQSDTMPSASQAGVQDAGIDQIGPLRPDLVDASRVTLAELREVLGDVFGPIAELLASAYWLRPEVAKLIGYRSRVAIPLDDELMRKAHFDELLEPVVARGNVWRLTEGP